MLTLSLKKSNLLRWSAWFFLGNVLLLWLIGLIYYPAVPPINTSFANNFLVFLSYLTHLTLIGISPLLIVIPVIFLMPWRPLVFIIAVSIAAILSSLFFIDTLVYNIYQFHLNGATLALAFQGITKGVLGLSLLEKILPPLFITTFLLIEALFAYILWRSLQKRRPEHHWLPWMISSLSFIVCVSFLLVSFGLNQTRLHLLVDKTRFLPFYVNLLEVVLPQNKINAGFICLDNKKPLQWLSTNKLIYPIQPLHYAQIKHPLNLVIIVIDTWRADMLKQEVTPNILAFSKKAWTFENHFSGGNSTLPGIFSIFYGLPATYVTAMEEQKRAPIFLDTLQQKNYQIGIFSSAPLYTPPLNLSVFQNIKNLNIEKQPAETVYDRDQLVTDKFKQFIANRNHQQPFFNFLFFDAAHSYCGSDNVPGPFQPTAKSCNRLTFNRQRDFDLYFNRYKNALLSVDNQVKQVITILQSQHLLDNTVVLILGDHGEEFDDSGKGYYGHGSDFSHYQVQTPLIVYWPHVKPLAITYQTSHFDIVPTLMSKLLGCRNPFSDYGVGTSLMNSKPRPYLTVSSYVDFAVLEPNEITTIYPAGDYHIDEEDGQIGLNNEINMSTMEKVYRDLHKFYLNNDVV